MKLLNNPVLNHIFTKKVRNSWEHHDQRLDKVLKNLNVGDSLCEINVSATPPRERSFTLKRFDPTTMSIHFLDDAIGLDPCFEEIEVLDRSIQHAFTSLNRQSEV